MKGAMMISLLCLALVILSGCAANVTFQEAETMKPVGFLHGLWHGIILPIAWIISLFNSSTAIYAIYNNGGWYNFGFVLGCGALLGNFRAGR